MKLPVPTPSEYIFELSALYVLLLSVPGDLVELGVASGRNSILLSKLGQPHQRHYWGFDTFSGYTSDDLAQAPILMPNQRSGRWNNKIEKVEATLQAHGVDADTTLIEGDLKETVPTWLETPRTVAWIYVDCNAYLASIAGMRALWPVLSPGGLLTVDEHQVGGETRALREFALEVGLELTDTRYKYGPPFYLRKPHE